MSKKPFCVHPFVRHHVDNQGYAEVCCEAVREPDTREHTTDWHAQHLRQNRRQWLQGEWPKECVGCLQSERQGIESLRQQTNEDYPELTQWHRDHGSETPPPPVAYDLRMNNLCNMACVMCGSNNSTLHHALQISHQGHAEFPRSDPRLVDECVAQITRNRSTIQHLSFAGGEPMVMPGVLRIIKMLCESGDAPHIQVRFTTNGTVWRPQWAEWLDQFQSVHVDVSVDAVGEMAHRMRPPIQWHSIEHNILDMQAWCGHSDDRQIMLACTVHALNLTALPDLHAWHTRHGIRAWYDRVRDPLWLRPRQAPTAIKQHTADWISVLPDDDFRANILSELSRPREDTAEIIAQQHQGCAYLQHIWRSPWHTVMPQLAHWS